MEDIIDVIESRKEILRKYKDEKIPQEFVLDILEAGRWANSCLPKSVLCKQYPAFRIKIPSQLTNLLKFFNKYCNFLTN